MKRLVVCCDGTWNVPDQKSPTNVVKLALAIADEDSNDIEQRVFYHSGVGTIRKERFRGGSFGKGLSHNVKQCYRWLAETYEPGDQLFFFGFSRGAFTARSVAGLVRNSGILRREHLDRVDDAYALYRKRGSHPRGTEAVLFRCSFSRETRIKFIGVFDTVGALGIPSIGLGLAPLLNRRWGFHDTELSTKVGLAYQALAIDERRRPFQPTLWNRQPRRPNDPEQTLEQVWFRGVHSDVGGGYKACGLAEIPLLWMADRAAAAGLDFKEGSFSGTAPGPASEDAIAELRAAGRYVAPDGAAKPHRSRKGIYRLLRPYDRRPGLEEVIDPEDPPTRAEFIGRPPWAPWSRATPGSRMIASDQSIASTARDRFRAGDDDAPRLGAYLDGDDPRITDVRVTPGLPTQ
jgi:hypothetical protein